ncbi:hypothetical protein ASD98_20270 [Flavobacterium sp. Root186]|nr:hypothetical protein ASD98_20270 [Flavobacterium sp. Root186]
MNKCDFHFSKIRIFSQNLFFYKEALFAKFSQNTFKNQMFLRFKKYLNKFYCKKNAVIAKKMQMFEINLYI